MGSEPVRAGKALVVVPFTVAGAGEPDVAFSAHLVDSASGQNLPLVVQPVNRLAQGRVHVQFLEITLDQVPPGTYALYVNAGDRTTGNLASAHLPLTVAR
jgi:hypothetical protein